MLRSQPPIIKIYEALGAIADQRIEILKDTTSLLGEMWSAKVYSSSKEKFYTITYDPKNNAIMMNDNGAYRQGYLGYPGIALLFLTKKLPLNEVFAEYLKNIPRKDINTKHNNDFDATQQEIDEKITKS